jgi:hypothetical protein
VRVLINGNEAGELLFDGQALQHQEFSIPQSWLNEGQNTVRLIALGGNQDVSVIDFVRLTYWHTFTADSDLLRFTTEGKQKVIIDGFSNSNIRIIEVTKPESSQEITGEVQQTPAGFSITANLSLSGSREFFAFAEGRILSPARIVPNQPSSWNNKKNGADIIILTHQNFLQNFVPLQSFRESGGHSVALIDVEDIYDEFSFGSRDPKAIKDFLSQTNSQWEQSPQFLLLGGDASLDPRNYLQFGEFDFVPTKLVVTDVLETASDDWFVDFDDNGIPEIAVGRLPVRSAAEANAIVSKIIDYEQGSPSGGWKTQALLIADNNDTYTFDFEAAADAAESLLPATLSIQKILLGQTNENTARAQILDGFEDGKLIVNYGGHGSVETWANEELLTSADAQDFTNGQRLPFVIAMNCLNGYFQDVFTFSLAEALMVNPNGGAVAVWASSGFTDPSRHTSLDRELLGSLFGPESLTLGQATQNAKRKPLHEDVRRTWILFGDPATKLSQ